jgi:hypothetical protein
MSLATKIIAFERVFDSAAAAFSLLFGVVLATGAAFLAA